MSVLDSLVEHVVSHSARYGPTAIRTIPNTIFNRAGSTTCTMFQPAMTPTSSDNALNASIHSEFDEAEIQHSDESCGEIEITQGRELHECGTGQRECEGLCCSRPDNAPDGGHQRLICGGEAGGHLVHEETDEQC